MASYKEIIKAISAGQFLSVYLFYGDEPYLQEELVSILAGAYLGEQSEYGLERIEGSAQPLEDIFEKAGERNLFSSRRMIVVENPPYIAAPKGKDAKVAETKAAEGENVSAKDDAAAIHDIIIEENISNKQPGCPDLIVAFKTDGADRRKRIFKLIDRTGGAVDCASLKGKDLSDWIRKKAVDLGKKIDHPAVEKMLLAGDLSLNNLQRELEKYAAHAGDEEIISTGTIDLLFAGNLQARVFWLADALAEGQLQKALVLLERLYRAKEKPIPILFMLVRQYRLLLIIKGLEAEGVSLSDYPRKLSVPPFAVTRLRRQASLHSSRILEEALFVLQQADKKIKTGQLEAEQAVRLALRRIDYTQRPG